MIQLLIFVIALHLATSHVAYATSEQNNTEVKQPSSILILGDSLSASFGLKESQGWVYRLNQTLKQKNAHYTLINASISGETTGGALSRLPGILSSQKIDYLLVELGGNDGLRGFPPKLIKNNLLQIIKLAQEQNIKVLVMDIKIPPNYGQRYNQLFQSTFKEVTKQTNIPLLPFFMEKIAVNPKLMQNDGIHPNLPAQALIEQIMEETLNSVIAPILVKN